MSLKRKFIGWIVLLHAALVLPAGAFTLQPPRMVLNRSLFLEWEKAPATGFVSYEVFASTNPTALLSAGNRVATRSNVELCYSKIMGLQPTRTYYFQARLNTSAGSHTSTVVSATTLADGTDGRVPSVMYHHILPRAQFPAGYDPGGWVSTENFSRDMAYFKAHNVHPVGMEEIVAAATQGVPLPSNPVFLTFDDGYLDFLEHAVPILLSNDFQAVNAIVTRMTGGTSQWAVPEWPLGRLMTWAQVKECQRKGFRMGSHTQTHVDLYQEPSKISQVAASKDDLVRELYEHPLYFCYPWGMGGHQYQPALTAVRNAGFTFATKTWAPGIASIHSDSLWFPRVFANQADTLRDYLIKLDLDSDKDGLRDYIELDWGLDPGKWDTDGDLLGDYEEVVYDGNASRYNPYHPASNSTGTDLNATSPDTDFDGLTDYEETDVTFTNPLLADTDGDGIRDGDEVKGYGSNPLLADTDGDGIPDGLEVQLGLNPVVHNGRLPFFTTLPVPAPPILPGVIQIENFDYGGSGLAYSDTTPANLGKGYRPFEQVDLTTDPAVGSGISLGWTPAGEWLTYSASSRSNSYFKVGVRVAALGSGGVFHIEINGEDVTGPMPVPNTGGWTKWTTVESPKFSLPSGTNHIIKLVMDAVGSGGNVAAFDNLTFTEELPPPPPGPYGGSPWVLPGTVQFEDFDVGGEGVAYSDTTAENLGKAYRVDEAVDVSVDQNAGNNHTVGWTL
ncbi:MAG: polysaccharide deacetylase family protein, partial [Verrucomicrobiota bacterium]|nr:polysaccharide deacetylase family protein [Verrucomicrobiota bacterium]